MAPSAPFTSQPRTTEYDAVVVGSGPNGFAAAITLAEAGLGVLLVEAKDTPGGGMRSAELTLPGYVHDICSAVHPLGCSSPFFASLPLEKLGLEWVHPAIPLAHPLDGGRAAALHRSVDETAARLPKADAARYRRVFGYLAANSEKLLGDLLGPLPFPPRHPLLLARFGVRAARSGAGFARSLARDDSARALFAGNAAHSILPLEKPFTAAVGILLTMTAHAVGWPFARGGSGAIADALAKHFLSLGGEIICGRPIESMENLPKARAYLFDTSPRALERIAGGAFPGSYRRLLKRYRYGPGIFKLDLALKEPIPWLAEECRRAGTVHVGGTLEEVASSERDSWLGTVSANPFVLVAQASVFDPTRAPGNMHTCWAYCHVPHGSTVDMRESILNRIEQFAPGFRDTIIAMHAMGPSDYEAYNSNNIGGDIIGGVQDLGQMFTRPAFRLNPYTTPARHLYLCSASTPPGGGVHGMCGFHAAQAALKRQFR